MGKVDGFRCGRGGWDQREEGDKLKGGRQKDSDGGGWMHLDGESTWIQMGDAKL